MRLDHFTFNKTIYYYLSGSFRKVFSKTKNLTGHQFDPIYILVLEHQVDYRKNFVIHVVIQRDNR